MITRSRSPGATRSETSAPLRSRTPVVRVKTSTPSLSVDQDALVFVRSAWGNAAPEVLGGYTIPGRSVFRPRAERRAHDLGVPAGGRARARRRCHAVPRHRPARARCHRAPGGRAAAGPRWSLPAPEPLHAGRAGGLARRAWTTPGTGPASVRVRDVEWVAHPERSGVRREPPCGHVHRLRRHQPRAAACPAPCAGAAVSGADGTGALARAAAAWEDAGDGRRGPRRAHPHAMAYDARASAGRPLRRRAARTATSHDTWEWDGTTVEPGAPRPARAPARWHAMAYDSARGRVVLFGGYGDSGSLRRHLGVGRARRWTQRGPGQPRRRATSHAHGVRRARGRVVLFGGHRPRPVRWRTRGSGTARPGRSAASGTARVRARSATRWPTTARRGRVVLFGGSTARRRRPCPTPGSGTAPAGRQRRDRRPAGAR